MTLVFSYMAVKNQKLQEQFEAEATSSSNSGSNSGKPIFQGVSGFTVPSSQVLMDFDNLFECFLLFSRSWS